MNAKPLSIVLLAFSLSACAQNPSPVIKAPSPVIKAPAPVPMPPARQGLTPQIMYQLLLGEIASQRGNLKLSAEVYADLVTRTRDARVAQRATELALHARQPQLALRNARLWREYDPGSIKAAQTLASLLIGVGRAKEARPHLEAWLQSGDAAEIFQQLHGFLARQKDKQAVLALVEDLAASYPALPEAWFALGQAAMQAGNADKAVASLDEALRLRPAWQAAALFKAQVLLQARGNVAALHYLDTFLAEHPAARDVRLAYAKQLARAERFDDARAQFERLRQEQPDNPEHHFAIGLVALQTRDLAEAERSFLRALELGHGDAGSARFFLGQLAEARDELTPALNWYREVDGGRHWLDAQLRAAIMMARLGRLEDARAWLREVVAGSDAERLRVVRAEAHILRDAHDHAAVFQVLSDALAAHPDAPELLYDRAMAAEKLDRLDVLERDLRRLIEIKPDYAHAYNALGYTLADRTDRIEEALQLLEIALRLAPDDPYILDSMGWALFKASRNVEAIDYLRRAFAARPDPEIAAHLGEALWQQGERDEARRIWQGALQLHPDNEVLRETTSRLMH